MDNPINKITDASVETGKKAVAGYGYAVIVLLVILIGIVGADRALYIMRSAIELLLWLINKIMLI